MYCDREGQGGGSFKNFYLASLTTIVFTLKVKKRMWKFCWLQSMFFLIMHSKTEEMTTRWVSNPGEYTEIDIDKDFIFFYLIPYASTLTRDNWRTLGP